MLDNISLSNILFIDIETVPMIADYQDLPENFKSLWDKKSERIRQNDEDTGESVYARAGIYSEFGKIICISVGYFSDIEFRIKSFYGDDESIVLNEFAELLNRYYNKSENVLCAHNGKEFDYPYLARRMLINGISLPKILNIAGKKPWEINHLDTMELWKFGDYKNYTSLNLLTTVFNIPTPKNDISGEDIARVYWIDHDLERIVRYCQKDVLAVAQVFMKYRCNPLIKDANVVIV